MKETVREKLDNIRSQSEDQANLLDYQIRYLESQGVDIENMLKKQDMTSVQIAELYEMTKNSFKGIGTGLLFAGLGIAALFGAGLVKKNKKEERLKFLEEHEFEIEKQIKAFMKNETEVRKFVVMHVTEKRMRAFIEQRTQEFGSYDRKRTQLCIINAVLGRNGKVLTGETTTEQIAVQKCVTDAVRYRDAIVVDINEEVDWYLSKEEKLRKLVQDSLAEKFTEDNFKGTDDPIEAIMKQLEKR